MFFYKEVFAVEVTSWLFFTSCINDITNVIFFSFSLLYLFSKMLNQNHNSVYLPRVKLE